MIQKFPIHSKAKSHLRQTAIQIHNSIFAIAIQLAKRDRLDEVQTTHIDEARQLLSPKARQRRAQEFAKILDGALIGAFIPGFVTSLPTETMPTNTAGLILYTVLGMVGLIMIFWGFR